MPLIQFAPGMPLHNVSITPYTSAQFSVLKEFLMQHSPLKFFPGMASDRLSVFLEKPGYTPEQDLFLCKKEDALIGFVNVIPEMKIGRIVLDYALNKNTASDNLLKELLKKGLERGRSLGACKAHFQIPSEPSLAGSIQDLSTGGPVCTFYELELKDLAEKKLETAEWDDRIFSFKQNERKHLARLQNRVFSGSWGFCPNDEEDIAYYLKKTGCRMEDVLGISDRVKHAGYFWPAFIYDPDAVPRRARVHMFGIHPHYRRQGLGLRILLSGMKSLQNQGFDSVGLTVQGDNEAACRIYFALGFQMSSVNLWFEAAL